MAGSGVRWAEAGTDLRAGVHVGEVELVGDDVAGLAVVVAARIGDLAGRGEVLVSSTVRDVVLGTPVVFKDRGTQDLKGVPRDWPVYAVASTE